MDAITSTPEPRNEPVRSYGPGSGERESLTRALAEQAGQQIELTMTIGGLERMAGGEPFDVVTPHRHGHVLGRCAQAGA
ncbi:MAG: L-glutamate gamma-semialdehyde dehydrogenase, partial [Pseudonocardiaceae bacterium]